MDHLLNLVGQFEEPSFDIRLCQDAVVVEVFEESVGEDLTKVFTWFQGSIQPAVGVFMRVQAVEVHRVNTV